MQWDEKIVGLHPLLITGAFVLLFLGGGHATNLSGFVMWAPAMAIMIAPVILWHYALYRVTTRKLSSEAGTLNSGYWFLILVISMSGFLVLTQLAVIGAAPAPIAETAFSTLLFLSVLSYFAAIWSAARNLRRLELGRRILPWHAVIGTFLLEFYLPIGIWFIHGRIQKAVRDQVSHS